MLANGLILPITLGFIMCLNPISMWETSKVSPVTGKRVLSSRWKPIFGNRPPLLVPCGKCLSCLESRRNEWCKRMLLESTQHLFSSFITLTYNEESLPADRLCSKRDIQLFLKRLRFASRDYGVLPFPDFKYFLVCEYGKKTHRPHYHAIFFGIDCLESRWKPRLVGFDKFPRVTSDVLSSIWSNGFVLVDRVTPNTIRYVSKYITKQSSGCWSLKSIGISKSLFVSSDGLTRFGFDSFSTGFVHVPSLKGTVKVRTPKFLDRYVDKFCPDLYDSVCARRRAYFVNSVADDPSSVRSRINHQLEEENKRRYLDNEETTLCIT